jgi:predicted MPP superfamily phosphohydrolase
LLTALIIFLVALGALAAYALYVEPRRFRSIRVRMETTRNLDGKLEILHVSDLHLKKGEEAKLNFLRGLHKRPVDMVFVTGDMIDDDSGIDYCVEALRGFKARVGVFAVFGAHDHWDTRLWNVVRDLSLGGYRRGRPNDFARLKRELEGVGVVCLENEPRRVALSNSSGTRSPGEAELWVVGVDDVFAGLGDFQKAVAGVPADAFRILLTHTVENPEEIAVRAFDAVFAGHSHGGQVRIPFVGPVITRSSLRREHASGVFRVGGTPFHINNGIGTGKWTGFRFLCPPEASYVELTGPEPEDTTT